MRRKVTLLDVSRKARVSQGTVSRVLNDRPVRVNGKTRERIIRLAGEMGYSPNRNAQALKTGRSGALGVLAYYITDDFVIDCVRSMEKCFAERGLEVLWISCSQTPQPASSETLARVGALPIDGLIVIESGDLFSDRDILRLHAQENIPLVTVLRRVRGGYVSNVSIDNRAGMRKLVRHLLDLGHRDIAFCQDENRGEMALRREEAFVETLRDAGVPVREEWMPRHGNERWGKGSFEEGEKLASLLLDLPQRPTAVVGWNNVSVFALVRQCAARGLRVPEDISIAGLENIRIAEYYNPSLTALDPDFDKITNLAIEMLMAQIENETPLFDASEEIIVPRLIVRESTGPVRTPAEDGAVQSTVGQPALDGSSPDE
jgi:LacI family transcriptional regulator, galactose operon repressor